MRVIRKNQKVRTNDKWRTFSKTDTVIRGTVTGFIYDRKTAVVKCPDGTEYYVHRDWLEIDRKGVER